MLYAYVTFRSMRGKKQCEKTFSYVESFAKRSPEVEEEKKFFKYNGDYDPQFEYEGDPQNNEFIRMFPAPKFDLLPRA